MGIHFVTFPCVLTLFYTVQSMLVVAFPAISSHTACEDLSDVRLDVVVHMSSFIHQNTLMAWRFTGMPVLSIGSLIH